MNLVLYETIKIAAFTREKIIYKTAWWKRTTIDFETCNNSWKDRHRKKIEVMGEAFASRMTGYRNAFHDPPYVEFCTTPVTRFEFASRESYDAFRRLMEENDWQTIDHG